MAKHCAVYDLLISCPSDVAEYIPMIELAVNYFNNHFGRLNDVVIRTVHWSKNARPAMGAPPQTLLNQQIVDGSDMVVGLFWTKFGTPTKEYGSGAEEEIERMIAQGKPVFLYFLDIPIPPSQLDCAQYEKVREFKKRHKTDGIYFEIRDPEHLAVKLCDHLTLHFGSVLQGSALKERSKTGTILWVDDEPENNAYKRRTLEQYGLEFTLALSTQQALSILRTQSFSLIISDMGRREGPREGYALLNELRKTDRTTPFLIYSNLPKEGIAEKVLRQGGQGYTNDPTELVRLVLQNLLTRD